MTPLELRQGGVAAWLWGAALILFYFFPFFPFGTSALFKRHLLSLALPCTSLAPSSTCQPVKKGKKKEKKRKTEKLEASL